MVLREYLTSARMFRARVRDEATGVHRWLWLWVYSPFELAVVVWCLAACWVLEKLGCE